jgi:hypothetical protein
MFLSIYWAKSMKNMKSTELTGHRCETAFHRALGNSTIISILSQARSPAFSKLFG